MKVAHKGNMHAAEFEVRQLLQLAEPLVQSEEIRRFHQTDFVDDYEPDSSPHRKHRLCPAGSAIELKPNCALIRHSTQPDRRRARRSADAHHRQCMPSSSKVSYSLHDTRLACASGSSQEHADLPSTQQTTDSTTPISSVPAPNDTRSYLHARC
jgi:hypothetical protein